MTNMHIPGFTAEASLYTSNIKMNMTSGHESPTVSTQVTPQVMQDPTRPRPPIIVKESCRVICFYTGGRYRCTVVC